MLRGRWGSVASALVLVVAASALARLFLGPAPPYGAPALHLSADPPGLVMGCATALLEPARVANSGDDLVLVSVATGDTLPVFWPAGIAAWPVNGRAVVVNPWGTVIGREGLVVDRLGGGEDADGVFHICPYGIPPAGS